MAMSDCDMCWNTICTCGYLYRNYNMEHLIKMRDLFQSMIDGTNKYSKKYNEKKGEDK